MTKTHPALRRLAPLGLVAGVVLAAAGPAAALPAPAADGPAGPRLIVWITVDQLRGGVLPRLTGRFGDDGFRRLLTGGVVWTGAHYRHVPTMTASGHATLFTGSDPRDHGVVSNDWVAGDGGVQYCVGPPPDDPGRGRGPWHLERPTVGDRLIERDPRSRVYGVSLKDRGAILPAGRRGVAAWYDRSAGRFVTDAAYRALDPGLAAWLAAWNEADGGSSRVDRLATATWSLAAAPGSYAASCGPADGCLASDPYEAPVFVGDDGRPLANPPYSLDAAPPGATRAGFARSVIRLTPCADELTARLALDLAAARGLGEDDAVDLLAVSFSALDYAGHAFGPDSVEYEDVVLHLDRTLATMFAELDKRVGDGAWIAALSSDHGVGSIPPHAAAFGTITGHLPGGAELVARANAALRDGLGVERDVVSRYVLPGLVLDGEALAAVGVAREDAAAALAREAAGWDGFRSAFTHADLRGEPTATPDPILAMARRAFRPERTPDVVLVTRPGRFVGSAGGGNVAMHGSPYPYDTRVPVVVWAPCRDGSAARCLKPASISRRVGPQQLAGTMLWLAGAGDGEDGLPIAD